jgi:hypothetical protein
VALDWLEWYAGGLRLTVVGQNIHRQMTHGHLLITPRLSAR